MRMNQPVAIVTLTLIAGLVLLPGCDSGERSSGAVTRLDRAAEAIRSTNQDIRKAFEVHAAEARDELEAARAAAEALISGRMTHPQVTAQRARKMAEEALQRGTIVLREAAEDGGEAAEHWARLIQDRMIRLERSLDDLTRSGREHADS